MHLIVTLRHPGHVRFYRHAIRELRGRGHEVTVIPRPTRRVMEVLDGSDIPVPVGHRKARETPCGRIATTYQFIRELLHRNPDVITGIGSPVLARLSAVSNASYVVFVDAETTEDNGSHPPRGVDVVCSRRRFGRDYGPRHRRYAGYPEIAYLHPARFSPDPGVAREHGLDATDPCFVYGSASQRALPQPGDTERTVPDSERILDLFERHGAVFTTTPTAAAAEDHGEMIDPADRLQMLWAADLVVGSAPKVAIEAALLGTPTVWMRSEGKTAAMNRSKLTELEIRYGLVITVSTLQTALDAIRRLIDSDDRGEIWRRRRRALVRDSADVTSFVVDTLLDAQPRGCARPDTTTTDGTSRTHGGEQ